MKGVAVGIAAGATAGFGAAGVAMAVGAAMGPPGWIVGALAGAASLAFWGREELGSWKVEDAVALATDEVVKILHAHRITLTTKLSTSVLKDVGEAFENLANLRVVNRDDSGTLLDCQEEMSALGLENKYLALKVLEAMRKCNTVMHGQGPPTAFLKESIFAAADAWPELKLSDDEMARFPAEARFSFR